METVLFIIILISILIDLLIGELPTKIHPVVWMGKIIDLFKPKLNKIRNKSSGVYLTLILLLIFLIPCFLLLYLLQNQLILYIIIVSILLSTTFSIKLLMSSAEDIIKSLNEDPEKAKKDLSYLVSRKTDKLSESEIISATIESLTENITDSIITPLLFTYIFGLIGAVTVRIINTLDAMVGYKNEENLLIGWFPANLDDIINYIPARFCGILIVLSAFLLKLDYKNSYKIMKRDARVPPSPNSGFSMAATAGALNVQLVKPNTYILGDPKEELTTDKINDAIKLTKITTLLFFITTYIFFKIIYSFLPIIFL